MQDGSLTLNSRRCCRTPLIGRSASSPAAGVARRSASGRPQRPAHRRTPGSGQSRTRQVENLLAGVDPELAVPADRIRPLGAGRWEIKAVIDDDCRRGLEQLKGLLSHVDPHMTLGQLVGRVVREAVERHDPARPPRGRRTGRRATASGTDETRRRRTRSGAPPRRHVGTSARRAGGRCGRNFGAVGGRPVRRRIGATERRADGRRNFASEGADELRARPHSGSDPVRGSGPTFGAEGGMPPATASRDRAVPGTEPRHSGRSPAAGLEARSGLLQLRRPG